MKEKRQEEKVHVVMLRLISEIGTWRRLKMLGWLEDDYQPPRFLSFNNTTQTSFSSQ